MFFKSIKLRERQNLLWPNGSKILGLGVILAGVIGFQSVILANTAITNPRNNRSITCETGSTRNQCIFSVTVNLSNLPANSYISILLNAGNNLWWHSGNSIQYTQNPVATIDYLTVNPQTTRNVRAVAIVTRDPLPEGQKYRNLPPRLEQSSIVQWRVPR